MFHSFHFEQLCFQTYISVLTSKAETEIIQIGSFYMPVLYQCNLPNLYIFSEYIIAWVFLKKTTPAVFLVRCPWYCSWQGNWLF